jgi:integrase
MSDTKKPTNPERSKKDAFDILDKRVKIYRTASKVWQMQMWVKEEQKYVRESLHTEDKEVAINKAEERYIFYRAKIQQNEKIFSITLDELRNRYLEHIQQQVNSRQLSKGRAGNVKTYTKHCLEFLGKNTKIQNVPEKKFRDYLAYRQNCKPDILLTVIRNESVTIKQMYRWAVDEGLLNSNYNPDFGTIKVPKEEGIRESYTVEEYKWLVGVSKNWYKAKDVRDEEDRYYRRMINEFIVLMANGGFRTGELHSLKWKDVKKIVERDGDKYAEITIRAENVKTRKSRTFEMRRGDVFERIRGYSNYTEKDDFVFSQPHKNAQVGTRELYGYFNELIRSVNGKYSGFDVNKDLYCLRHFFITIRILAGLNVYDIAKICGTSLVQIQKHYDAAESLVTSKKMNKCSIRFDQNGNIMVD